VPGIEDGVRGLAFVEQAVNSSRARAWVPLNKAADENAGMRG
jgi:hypothetical protein